MTIINILEDGTTYPPVENKDLVIKLAQGQISIGAFDQGRFINEIESYLHEPANAPDLKADVIAYITAEMPGLFARKDSVHVICPPAISAKASWKREEFFQLRISPDMPL